MAFLLRRRPSRWSVVPPAIMVEKRKASTRSRADVAAKRHSTTPPDDASSAESVDDGLPTKVEEGEALPTLEDPQSDELPSKDFQSVADR